MELGDDINYFNDKFPNTILRAINFSQNNNYKFDFKEESGIYKLGITTDDIFELRRICFEFNQLKNNECELNLKIKEFKEGQKNISEYEKYYDNILNNKDKQKINKIKKKLKNNKSYQKGVRIGKNFEDEIDKIKKPILKDRELKILRYLMKNNSKSKHNNTQYGDNKSSEESISMDSISNNNNNT